MTALQHGGEKARVLIAEDSMLIGLDLESIVFGNGCEVVGRVECATDALAMLAAAQWDIAIVGYILKDGPADQLARALDEKGVPYAICTGHDHAEISAKYPRTPILSKPYMPEDVARVIDSLMAARLAAI